MTDILYWAQLIILGLLLVITVKNWRCTDKDKKIITLEWMSFGWMAVAVIGDFI